MTARPTTRETGTRHRLLRAGALAVVTAMALAGCGGENTPDDAATATPVPSETTPGPDPTTPPATDRPSEDPSDDEPTDDATTTADEGGLPGEPWDGFARAGDELVVVGVAHDDVLNIRAVPGTDGDVVATAAPTDVGLVATGEARQLPSSFWYEVEVDGVTGWASQAFLAFPGPVDDVTSSYVAEHGRPSAETMAQLGELVAQDYASEEPASRIVQSVAPSVGDLGEVVMDVVGLGDDSVLGNRVHVFATPDEGGEGFTLSTIELWTYCLRGISPDTGICV